MSLFLALTMSFGQIAAPSAFEVASIREALPLSIENVQAGRFHVGMNVKGSRADYGFVSLADLVPYAYRVKRYQVSGPQWMNKTQWDILAKFPSGQPAYRAPEMMQNLLAERFKLAIHREDREQPVYELVVGNGRLKIQEAAAEEAGPATSHPTDPDSGLSTVRMGNEGGSMSLSGGATGALRMTPGQSTLQIQIARISMSALADMLAQFADRPIVNATRLKGDYQVALALPTDLMTGMPAAQKLMAFLGLGSPGMVPGGSTGAIFQAVKDLGLELKSRKAPVETIIVDRGEKTPTAN
jgi:uncharacterized protein (TIGR03435 family)